MTEYSRSANHGSGGAASDVAARHRTAGALGKMRSPRGFLASMVFLAALPVAIAVQVLLGSGSSLTMHVALTVGCVLFALAAPDFGAPRLLSWTGRVAAGAFALQGASEVLRNDSFSRFALQVLGNYPERALVTLLVLFLVSVLLTTSRGRTRVLGFAVMAVVVGVEAYNYALLFLGEGSTLIVVYLLPLVWLLFESRKTSLPEHAVSARSAPAPRSAGVHGSSEAFTEQR
jgi:hypothetical protein